MYDKISCTLFLIGMCCISKNTCRGAINTFGKFFEMVLYKKNSKFVEKCFFAIRNVWCSRDQI